MMFRRIHCLSAMSELPDRGVAGGEDGLHGNCGYGVVLGTINLES